MHPSLCLVLVVAMCVVPFAGAVRRQSVRANPQLPDVSCVWNDCANVTSSRFYPARKMNLLLQPCPGGSTSVRNAQFVFNIHPDDELDSDPENPANGNGNGNGNGNAYPQRTECRLVARKGNGSQNQNINRVCPKGLCKSVYATKIEGQTHDTLVCDFMADSQTFHAPVDAQLALITTSRFRFMDMSEFGTGYCSHDPDVVQHRFGDDRQWGDDDEPHFSGFVDRYD